MFNSHNHGPFRPVTLGTQIQKAMQKVGGRRGSSGSKKSSSDQQSDSASCSGIEDDKSSESGRKEGSSNWKMQRYRYQLEQEVKKLQRELQEEIDLHVALANAVAHDTIPLLKSPAKLPFRTQELLATIASLESAVSELEKELDSLQYRLCHERNERLLAETHIGVNGNGNVPSISSVLANASSASRSTWEESISSLRDLKFGGGVYLAELVQQHLLSECGHEQKVSENSLLDVDQVKEQVLLSATMDKEEEKTNLVPTESDPNVKSLINSKNNLWNNPNQLSEEMVRCMRNIFLCLSESSKPTASSPAGQVSISDSSIMPSMLHSNSKNERFDPYRVNYGKVKDIGNYGLAADVSWMSVGKEQLEYASDALKKFRFLVEQLAKVNPASMKSEERIAFWINLYNALIMHAYLAYGVPRNEIKLFSLMQKACYIVGGQSVSAAEIEFVILKMKAPVHRPQLALMLALHKFKITEEHKKYSIDGSEPLVLFALSCGMFSSPAIRIFTAQNVRTELQTSMRDYIRASVGINEKGKLLIPKLLLTFAKGIVEDSLLVDWIYHQLSPEQVAVFRDSSVSQKKQRLLGVRSFTVLPFDSRFRYLFLPDGNKSRNCLMGSTS